MAISSGELDNRISDALKDAARNWALRQEGALDHAERVAPLLDGTPPPFRAASWLNTGLEATRTLFLDAALAGAAAARQASLPLAVASQAMERFQRAYRDETARVNAVMQGDYGAIKNQLKDNVREAANDVANTPFGVRTVDVLHDVLRHRLDDLDREMAYSHCINVIQHAEHGVVEVRTSPIQERTSAGYGALCRRIYDVYRGSHALGYKTLWRFKPTPEACARPGLLISRPHRENYDPIVGGEAGDGCWSLAGRGNIKDRRQIAWILSNIWALDVHHERGLLGQGTSWVWPAPEDRPPLVDTLTASYARRGVEEFRASLEAADRAEWPRTLRVRRGAA